MEAKILKVLVGLGVPGVALGFFYLLLKAFSFDFAEVPAGWMGPIVVTFLLIVGGVTVYAMTLWKPVQGGVGHGVSFSIPESSPSFRFIINALAALDGKTADYSGFNDAILDSAVKAQDISASTIDQAMLLVRGLTDGAVPAYDVSRTVSGGYLVTVR